MIDEGKEDMEAMMAEPAEIDVTAQRIAAIEDEILREKALKAHWTAMAENTEFTEERTEFGAIANEHAAQVTALKAERSRLREEVVPSEG